MRSLQLLLLCRMFDALAHISACTDRHFVCAKPVEATMSTAVVLVVEDNAIILLNALDLVTNAGFEAVGAANADEAIAILEARADIRMVFTDIEMPGTMDGVKLAHHIRHRWPPVHLIIASGHRDPRRESAAPGSRFFSKPYDDAVIVKEMTRMLTAVDAPEAGHKA
jgi:CheY-like chemotaxis protein